MRSEYSDNNYSLNLSVEEFANITDALIYLNSLVNPSETVIEEPSDWQKLKIKELVREFVMFSRSTPVCWQVSRQELGALVDSFLRDCIPELSAALHELPYCHELSGISKGIEPFFRPGDELLRVHLGWHSRRTARTGEMVLGFDHFVSELQKRPTRHYYYYSTSTAGWHIYVIFDKDRTRIVSCYAYPRFKAKSI